MPQDWARRTAQDEATPASAGRVTRTLAERKLLAEAELVKSLLKGLAEGPLTPIRRWRALNVLIDRFGSRNAVPAGWSANTGPPSATSRPRLMTTTWSAWPGSAASHCHVRRWGWRRAAGIARGQGQQVNNKRIQHLWRSQTLKVPYRKRKQLLRGHGMVIEGHVPDPTQCARGPRLPVRPDGLRPNGLDGLRQVRQRPRNYRPRRGDWCRFNGTGTVFVDQGSPWWNAWTSFKSRLRDEFVNGDRFDSLLSKSRCIEDWSIDYNLNRPQCARLAQPQRVRPSLDQPTPTHMSGWTNNRDPVNPTARRPRSASSEQSS